MINDGKAATLINGEVMSYIDQGMNGEAIRYKPPFRLSAYDVMNFIGTLAVSHTTERECIRGE